MNGCFSPRTLGGAAAITAAFVTASGCASPPKAATFDEAAFTDVRTAVAGRVDADVHWNDGDAAAAEIRSSVGRLLEQELTADTAVRIALINNAAFQATIEDVGIAQADVVQAGLLRNPVLDITARFPDRSPTGTNIEGSLVVDFIDLLFRPTRLKIAADGLDAAKARVGAAAVGLAADVRAEFHHFQAASQLLEMRKTVAEAAGASYETAQALHESGALSDLALVGNEATLRQAKLDQAQAEVDVLDARETLNVLLGLWGRGTTWHAAPRLAELPPADAGPTRVGLESLAVSQRLDLLASGRAAAAAARRLGLSRTTQFLPEGSVGISFEKDSAGQTVTGPALLLPVPLFDVGQGVVARGASDARRAGHEYVALAVRIRSDVRRAANRLSAARARAEYYRAVVLPLRQQIVEESQLRSNGMLISVFQLLQARTDEVNAGREYIESLRDYWVARDELERAVGGRLTHGPPATRRPASPTTAP